MHCGFPITVLGNLLLGKLLVFCQLCSTELDLLSNYAVAGSAVGGASGNDRFKVECLGNVSLEEIGCFLKVFQA